jgi:hypothetical protein
VSDTPSPPATVTGLVGVYDAVGTLRGELTYWVGARLGRTHCALCEVTHGLVTERTGWLTARDGLPVPFETYHLDDQPLEAAACAAGRAPVVLARTPDGLLLLLTPEDLDTCHGSPERLVELLHGAVAEAGLAWPAAEGNPPG